VLAVDAKTGKVIWHFNTIPQDDKDQGWEIAGPTWSERRAQRRRHLGDDVDRSGARMLYAAVANPFGDSTKRLGTNLFSDSIIALT
jgi:hypothetical protein